MSFKGLDGETGIINNVINTDGGTGGGGRRDQRL